MFSCLFLMRNNTLLLFFYSSGPVERSQSQSVAILHFFLWGGGGVGVGDCFNALITSTCAISIGISAPLK